jgi:hypothetical protein
VTERAEPLTVEEEAALRADHKAMPARGGSRDIARLLATLDAIRAERVQPSVEEVAAALAEGLHKAMCFGPNVLHNRLACERPQVYLALAEAALNHPATLHARLFSARPSPSGSIDVEEASGAMRAATNAMTWALPVIAAVRGWRDAPRVASRGESVARIGQRLEQALLDAINDFDEYARLAEADREEHPE